MSHSNQDSGHQRPERLVRFGSLIHLNLEDNFHFYMYGEGFMNQRVEMKKFEKTGEVSKDEDFSYCLFMILPFQDLNSFTMQQNLLEYFKEGATKKLGDEKKLEERKIKINEFKNKLESEKQYNVNTMQRQCGQKILLATSNFMLLHLNTMKFVCLNKENSENLYIELVEYPNPFCFFKFMPSLLLQTMRNDNFVYENELMHICCSEMIDGKRPFLMAEVQVPITSKALQSNQSGEHEKHLVYASIDNAKSWKLNLYQEPVITSEMDSIEERNYLRAGDIVWIVQTEKKMFVTSSRQRDPFLEIIKKLKDEANASKLTDEKQIKLIKNDLLENFKTQFESAEVGYSGLVHGQELSTNGLYRIEPIDFFYGGNLQWGQQYRIRHLISGMYLSCHQLTKGFVQEQKKYELRLTKSRGSQTIFKFIPIENLMFKYQSKQNIQKDSFLRIQHTLDDEILWLSTKEDGMEEEILGNTENQAIFESLLKDVNTFKFRKSSQQDIWETNFLQASISPFLKLVQNIVDVSEPDNMKTSNNKFNYFDLHYPKAIRTIKSLEDFITNRIISNISMSREYNYPSLDRQNKFCSQNLLGLFCWFLMKVFPKKEEFDTFMIKADESFLKEENEALKSKNNLFKGREKLYRQCATHLKNKYTLSYQIYALVKYSCYRNQSNQQYFFSFCHELIGHVGYGRFVQDSFQFCFQGNFNILQSLHQIHLNKKVLQRANQESYKKESKQKSFFKSLVKRLKIMEPYTKSDILSLLASFCLINNNTIYINQEKIFSSFIDNRQIIFNTLLKVREEVVVDKQDGEEEILIQKEQNTFAPKKKQFMIETRRRTAQKLEYDIVSRKLHDFDKKEIKKQKEIGNYFLCQLDLYSNMCANRNFTCGKAFSDIFPQSTLLFYIQDSNISIDLRARLARLQRNLYLDKEPRLVIQKPNLVRIFKSQEDRMNDKQIKPLIFDPVILKMLRQPELRKKKENLNYLLNHKKKFEKYLSKENETDIYVKFIKNNANEDYTYIQQVRLFIKQELQKCFKFIMMLENLKLEPKNYPEYHQPEGSNKKDDKEEKNKESKDVFSQASNEEIYFGVFNSLTYETIKNFHLMLKFGLFTEYAGDKAKEIFKDIISYLSFILEFDIDYTSELTKNGSSSSSTGKTQSLKRSNQLKQIFFDKYLIKGYINNIQKQIEELEEGMSLLSVKNIGGDSMKFLTDLTNLVPLKKKDDDDDQGEEGEDIVRGQYAEEQSQEQNAFLNTYQSLLKLISKYSNKTFKKKNLEIEINKDLETLIKIEICEIFEYLLDWREDFLIQNAMNYFTEKFYECNKENDHYLHKDKIEEYNKDLLELLPENMFGVGQPVLQKKRKFKSFKPVTKNNFMYDPHQYTEQVENIDDIIRRPFVETLLLSFYFTEDPDLQNKLCNLISRGFTQKQTLIDNIDKINLVDSGNSDSSYQQMSKLISRLKALISYSQSWLQIIEQNVYNEKAEQNLDITYNKLNKLYSQFQQCLSSELEIKQKIFKHLEGHKVLLKFLEQGTGVLQANSSYFSSGQTELQQFSYKQQFMKRVMDVFGMCHKILQHFCTKNKKIQKTMFKNYRKLLVNQNYLNLGQVEFICEIFRQNKELSIENNQDYLMYMTSLIETHGQYPQFLELFNVLIKNTTSDNNEVQKKVISHLLDSKIIKIINPFLEENFREDKATRTFLELSQLEKQQTLEMYSNHQLLDDENQKSLVIQEQQEEKENDDKQQNKKFDKEKTIKFYQQQSNDQMKKEYKLKLIEIVTMAFKTTEIGITFIYKSFLHIRVSSLFKLLAEEMMSSSSNNKLPNTNANNNNNAQRQNILQMKMNIADLLLIYFYKLDQSVQHFQRCSNIFVTCVKIELNNIRNRMQYSESDKIFIIDNFLPIINEYNDNFLKDPVLLAIQKKENSQDAANSKSIYEFANTFLHNLKMFIDFRQFKKLDNRATSKLKNIAILASNFRINFEMPDILQELINSLQIENKEERRAKSIKPALKTDIKSSGNVFSKFRNCVNMILFLRLSRKNIKAPVSNQNTDLQFDQLQKIKKESRYLKLWTTFKQSLHNSQQVRQQVKNEHRFFRDSLMQFDGFIENKKEALEDLLVSREDLIKKFLSYIRFWKEMSSSKSSVIFVLKTLRHVIVRNESESSFDQPQDTNNNNSQKQQDDVDESEAKTKRQYIMDQLNSTIICTTLLLNENTRDKKYLYYLFRILISLLDGGNQQVQNTVYQFFTSNSDSEYFFSKIFYIIDDEIRLIKKNDGQKTSIGQEGGSQKPLIENVLRLIQLLCEGHNLSMQDYMRKQFNSKINYDLVSKIVELLVSIKVSNETYNAVKQCFDTLTEMVQGPCKQNQIIIMNSKFLEYAVDIMREEETTYVVKRERIVEKAPEVPDEEQITGSKGSNKSKMQKRSPSKGQKQEVEMELVPQEEKNVVLQKLAKKLKVKYITKEIVKKQARRSYIVRVKHKCLITLLSLLELNENDISIANRIRRTIPLSVIINEMIAVHLNYSNRYKGEYYRECFNLANQDEHFDKDIEKPEDELVIELGFNCYILINVFLHSMNKQSMDQEYHDVFQQIKDYQAVKVKTEESNSLLQNLQQLQQMTTDLVGAGLGVVKAVGQKAISLGADSEDKEKERLKKEQEEKDFQKRKSDALKFFTEKTLHIEILRNNKLSKLYFPRLPFFQLPKEYKTQFHDEVDYNSDKGKLRTLIETSKSLIHIMIHEEDCRENFRKFKIIGFVAEHKSLWENLAFYCNCALNFIIIASYGVYDYEHEKMKNLCEEESCDFDIELQNRRMYQPRMFGVQDYDWTKNLLFFLGISNLVLSSLIFVFFFIKRAPILLKDIWMSWFEEKTSYFKKLLKLLWVLLLTMKQFFSDFDFVYYALYMGFCVIGLVIHPFFFGFLTVDFLRFKILKNVVKAVWEPRVDMALTFMIFLLLEYYFTLIGYLLLYDQYSAASDRYGRCDVLWKCFITTFDWTFKATGSIGGLLQNPNYDGGAQGDPTKLQPFVNDGEYEIMNLSYLGRFFFDNIFMLTMVILLINMVAGIIIENFSALKDETQEKEYALKRKCFVCGIDRELIEKAYDDISAPNGFMQHIQRDHYMWDYVFFKAYLQDKDPKEFTGNESYVFDQFKTTDVSWFPVKRAIYVQDEDTKIKIERKTKLDTIQQSTQMLQQKLEGLRLKVNVVKSEIV